MGTLPFPATTSRLTCDPIPLHTARAFIAELHRHHTPPVGHLWSTGVFTDGHRLVGVAVIGRPSARALDNGTNVEVTRVCTDGTPNACSCLYGAARREARSRGYRSVFTYTMATEPGSSLRGAGWQIIATRPPRRGWDTPSRRRRTRGVDGVERLMWAPPDMIPTTAEEGQ